MAARTRQDSTTKSKGISDENLPVNSASFSQKQENISVRTFEDQATEIDRLGFEPYVKAIAKFLANKDTKPPLVLSIEGEWGSGKTSFMLQLKKELGDQTIIWFDPWRYDKEEELWAVFASHFVDELIRGVPIMQRAAGHVKRFIRRYQWKEGWFDLTLKTLTWVGLFILIVVIGQNAFFLGNQWVENIYQWMSNKDTDLPQSLIETGIGLGGVTSFLILLLYTVGKLMPIIEDPLKMDLRKYISSPNYEDRVPFIKRFQDDFKEILDIYIGKKTVFVFVDDLDRCEVPKAADVMSAINLMVGNDRRVVFIIAMDREKVAAGLAVKYEKILPYILVSRTYNRSKFANNELIGLEFGYEFIEKFVQLPFRIPQPDTDKIDNLLKGLQEDATVKETHLNFIQTWIKDKFASFARMFRTITGTAAAGEEGEGKQNEESEKVDGENAAKNKRRESIIIQTGPESEAFTLIVKKVAVAFDYNPRRIKQFINLFRLKVYIAAETGLFDSDPGTKEDRPLTLEKIAKLTALELRWPIFMVDIQEEVSALIALQQLAYGISLKAISSRVELWQTREDLMSFLKIGSPTDKDTPQDLWDLSTINLTRWMKVSPRVRYVTPFVPGKSEVLQSAIPEPAMEKPITEKQTPDKPTPDKPAQYISIDGKTKHNLAGEFCVAHIGGEDIYRFLDKWRKASPEHYARIIGEDNDKPTSIDDVRNMLSVYGYQASAGNILEFKKGLMGPDKNVDFSLGRFQQMLKTYSLIAGVRIEQKSAQLARQGIVIWVVLDRIEGANVEIYNPYVNGMQVYSYSQFIDSMGIPSSGMGLWVHRQVVP